MMHLRKHAHTKPRTAVMSPLQSASLKPLLQIRIWKQHKLWWFLACERPSIICVSGLRPHWISHKATSVWTKQTHVRSDSPIPNHSPQMASHASSHAWFHKLNHVGASAGLTLGVDSVLSYHNNAGVYLREYYIGNENGNYPRRRWIAENGTNCFLQPSAKLDLLIQ